MPPRLDFEILAQPDDSTCGPTCLQAVYGYWQDSLPLPRLTDEVRQLSGGGTLGVLLGEHALSRGYRVRLHSYNLNVFDPTWFELTPPELHAKLEARLAARGSDPRLADATRAYLDFIDLGGELVSGELSEGLIAGYLEQGVPLLTGLSATWLYQAERERVEADGHLVDDDISGDSQGHFVVVHGYDSARQEALVADPLGPNPMAPSQSYPVGIDRLLNSILLGILTYDANLIAIQPRG